MGFGVLAAENGFLYEGLGGAESWLGFPKSDEGERLSWNEPWRIIQVFEGGAIFRTSEYGSVAVPQATMDYLSPNPLLGGKLASPRPATGDPARRGSAVLRTRRRHKP